MVEPRRLRVLVVNAGTHPELAHLAAGLLRRGHEVTYLTSASIGRDGRLARAATAGPASRTWIGRNLRRRILPPPLRADQVVHRGAGLEAFSQLLRRVMPRAYDVALGARLGWFRWMSGRFVRRHASWDLIIAQQTCADQALANAPRTATKVLNFAIAHHRWVKRVMDDEGRRNPQWADFLQGSDLSDAAAALLDREVELADGILVASSLTRRSLIEQGVTDKPILIQPLGCDTSEFVGGETLAKRPTPSPGRLNVLFVGQLNQRKGISYLLDAHVAAAVPDGELRLVGPTSAALRSRIRDRYPGVTVLGPMTKAELGQQFAWADVVVLPSLAEGFGLSAIEAMALGVPCVVSSSTFAGDVVEDGVSGLIVPPADVARLAEALDWLARHPEERLAMGARAADVAARLDWPTFAAGAAEQLESLVAAQRDAGER